MPIAMHTEWTSVAAFWVSAAAALIASFAAFVSYVLYRSQSDPDVLIYVQADEKRATIINLVIENIGNASAWDISFETSKAVPSKAFGLDAANAKAAEAVSSGPLVNGIPFLPPGGKRVITWGQYGGLSQALGTGTILVTTRYRSHHFAIPWRIKLKSTCPLEIASFQGTDASDSNFLKHIAEDTKKLANAVERLAARQTSPS
jgi:hypothetical protein